MNEASSERTLSVGQLIGACLLFIGLCCTGGALLAATAIPVAAASGASVNALTGLFEDLPTDIDFTQPSQQSTIVAADGTEIAKFYAENRIIVTSDNISQYLKDAAVSIEDERFYEHNGVDAQGIMGALIKNVTGDNLSGGSTITQQYVKNALLEEGRIADDQELIKAATRQTLARKLNEARYAIAIENQQTKDQILTQYLNVAQFGPSQWGVESASRYFFGVHAKDVSISQAALLAGVTQAPNYWNPQADPERAQTRRDIVLGKMFDLGYITQEQYDQAIATNVADDLHITPTANGCASAGIYAYFCSTVVQDLIHSDLLGATQSERINKLYRGGLTVVSTVDPAKQQAAYDAVVATIAVNDPSDAQTALASVEPGTGKIVAMAQNTNYGKPTDEDPNATTINLAVGQDQGGGAGFQSGSTFKMFTLVSWLAAEHKSSEMVNGSKHTIPASEWTNSCFPEYVDSYSPSNAGGGNYGRISVRRATANSVNSAYADMASQLDLCDIWKTANAMGVRRGAFTTAADLDSKEYGAYYKKAGAKVGELLPMLSTPAMVLGINSVTPLSTANAYATLAGDGMMCEPITFTDIKDANGSVIATQQSTCTKAIEPDVARMATNVLQGVSAAKISGRPSAGKTGTTDNNKNVWLAGFTPQLATAVWVGHMDEERTLNNQSYNGRYYGDIFGATLAAPIYRNYMTEALKGLPAQSFKKPEKMKDEPDKIAVPSVKGMDYRTAASRLRSAGFGVSAEGSLDGPQDETVLSQSPRGGAEVLPGTTVHLIVSMPPETSEETEEQEQEQQQPAEDNNG